MSQAMLEVNELTTKYVTRYNEDVYAVDQVSLKLTEGQTLGIAGESGCGKSTLAHSLMGYYFPPLHYTSGEIIIEASLAIIGLGPRTTEVPTLGLMMNWAMIYQAHNLGYWWAWLPVLLVIALLTFSMNLMNTGLDQVFNPALRD